MSNWNNEQDDLPEDDPHQIIFVIYSMLIIGGLALLILAGMLTR